MSDSADNLSDIFEEDSSITVDILREDKADIMVDIGDMLGFDPQDLKTPMFTKTETAEIYVALKDAGYGESHE